MECPSCHKECDEIYQCKECDRMFCFSCREKNFIDAVTMGLDSKYCPGCGGKGVTITSEHESEMEKNDENDEDNEDDSNDDIDSSSSSEETSSNYSYSVGGDSSSSSSGGSGIGVGTVIILGIVALVAFKLINSQPTTNYQPVAVANPSPAPMTQRIYPAARSEGGELMSLQGSWPDGYIPTKIIVIPDLSNPRLVTFDEPLHNGDDLEIIFEPLWSIDLITVGKTIEMSIDEGDGYKSLNELQIIHRMIPREEGRPWLLKRRIVRFHRLNQSFALVAPLQFGIEKLTEAEVKRVRRSN